MGTSTRPTILPNLIAGDWTTPRGVETLEVPNPATGTPLGRVPLSDAKEVRRAAEAAREAQVAWGDVPVTERIQVLFRLKALLDRHLDDLAASVTAENGKTLDEARGEVRRGVEVVEFACGMPSLMQGRSLGQVSRGVDTVMLRFPIGVVAGITPFNFPAMIPLWMAPIAIACGNSFLHKPSERTPMTGNLLGELWLEAGLPRGVLSVVHGARETVSALLDEPAVTAISFVGSQPVAAHVYATAAAKGKRVQALGGAKNYIVVMPDAEMDAAAEIVLSSAFGNAGERCLAGSVVIAVAGAAAHLLPRLVERARELRIGAGGEAATEMGPLIRAEHRARVVGYIEQGEREGARLVLDGRTVTEARAMGTNGSGKNDAEPETHGDDSSPVGGYFLRPSIFTRVRPEMAIAREEIFGPVLSVMEAASLAEAIAIANHSRFGNSATICTTSGSAARTFAQRIEAGMVGVNIGVPAPVAWFPFAGWKQSFYGDLHATGEDAVNFYTERKVITTRWE